MMWDWHGYGGGAWFAMSFGMLVFWGLVIWFVVAMVRSGSNRGDAEAILAARFARGEINEDEYRQRLDVLHGARDRAA